jgi:hypothetical protein
MLFLTICESLDAALFTCEQRASFTSEHGLRWDPPLRRRLPPKRLSALNDPEQHDDHRY